MPQNRPRWTPQLSSISPSLNIRIVAPVLIVTFGYTPAKLLTFAFCILTLRSAGARYAQNDDRRCRCSVVPISGVVSTLTTQEGRTVAASFAAPAFVMLSDLTRLEVGGLRRRNRYRAYPHGTAGALHGGHLWGS